MNRRSFLFTTGAALGTTLLVPRESALIRGSSDPRKSAAARGRPSAAQLTWQRDERALFLHFGVNTFTNREWGDGGEDPQVFAPARLDARQWARTARASGFRAMILTAKHHDGFCLWPSRTTTHTVARSPWRAGQGDVVREFTEGCRAEGLRAGLYLSPWDRNSPVYGNSPRYNDLYCEQLTELLTNYGRLAEIWFDGANGEGPNGKRQVYDWPRVFALVRRLQPDAVMFSDAGPDVRWCGNENGVAGDPNWSTVDPAAVPVPGASGPGITAALQHGDPNGSVWRPAEADVSIRPGWFYHPAQDARVRTVDQLAGLYFSSVGRNSKLLLNVPPTPEGLLHATDVSRLSGMDERLRRLFAEDLASLRRTSRRATGPHSAVQEVDLGQPTDISIVRLEEDITNGQRVSRYAVAGLVGDGWRELTRGTTIGYAKIDRVETASVRRVRLIVEDAIDAPRPVRIRFYHPAAI